MSVYGRLLTETHASALAPTNPAKMTMTPATVMLDWKRCDPKDFCFIWTRVGLWCGHNSSRQIVVWANRLPRDLRHRLGHRHERVPSYGTIRQILSRLIDDFASIHRYDPDV